MTYSKSAWVMAVCLLLATSNMLAQTVSGHIYIAESEAPCSYAIIQAWPCGETFQADSHGAFIAECDAELDSLTVVFHGFKTETVIIDGRSHVDVPMYPLSVILNSITIDAPSSASTVTITPKVDLIQTLERTPGLRALDLGAGLVQPILRGLMGSRVVVLDAGIPQVGGRWGQDHGVLIDPVLYDGVEWAQGGGSIWLGPDAVGGGMMFSPIQRLFKEGSETRLGESYRAGDNRAKIYVLHKIRNKNLQWHVGLSASKFGDRNVPDSTFEYIGRTFNYNDGRLPNTSGTSLHALTGVMYSNDTLGTISLDIRYSQINQGLFPGIVGIPSQSDLLGDGDIYSVELPNQLGSRLSVTSSWMKSSRVDRTIKVSASSNERIESAPPHAHGYGPEPDNDLSLRLHETHFFAESKWEGYHGSFGLQGEYLQGKTSGWEFLLPDHYRHRISALADYKLNSGTLGFRVDAISLGNDAHSEPLYSETGEVIGDDVRAVELNTVMPSWAINYTTDIKRDHRYVELTATAYTRAPSNYALAANGIHHGTFRFEQGNPDLKPEKAIEARASFSSTLENFKIEISSFASLHKGFIHITPTASFAPVAHAGLIYSFQAKDAFRTGLEMRVNLNLGKGEWTCTSSVLGAWALETGLGLPFTPPADLINSYSYPLSKKLEVSASHRALAPSWLLARNEEHTEGASLVGLGLKLKVKEGELSLEADNLLNKSWLDHTSAYRALGLAAQGRWVSLTWKTKIIKQ